MLYMYVQSHNFQMLNIIQKRKIDVLTGYYYGNIIADKTLIIYFFCRII